MTGILHEVSCGYPASREMKRLGKDTQGYVSFPNRPIKWREMPLQAVSAKSILTFFIFGRKCVQSCVLWGLTGGLWNLISVDRLFEPSHPGHW